MPAQNAAAGGQAAAAQQDGGNNKMMGIARTIAIFIASQAAMRYGMQYFGLGTQSDASPATVPETTGGAQITPEEAAKIPFKSVPLKAEQAWESGSPMSMLLYSNTEDSLDDVNWNNPTLRWDGLTFGDWKDVRAADLILDVPERVRADNGSWWMDILLVKGEGLPQGKPKTDIAHFRKELTRWMPKRRVRKEKSLLSKDEKEDEVEEETKEEGHAPIVSYWARNLTVTVVSDSATVDFSQITEPLKPVYKLVASEEFGHLAYYPPIFVNDFWLLKENLLMINSTTMTLPLAVTYHAISNMKFTIFGTLTASFEQSAQAQGTGAELDEVKRMLTETNPILLITTAIVTVLHMLFEFLAFSSDVKHWKNKDKNNDLVGVSLNTILTNVFVQLIILLYLHDSSEETSWMILFTQGIGLLIEAWKITKVVDVRIRPSNNIIGYTVKFEDKHVLSEDEKKTQEYDRLAFKIVAWGALPLLIGYSIYSLLYQTHRSWYSFIITTLAQAIYMFGFVQLIPQLIINYKLKSVAHMPMKAMVYKTLSTVVDDFFAFCVKMPWLHRLACFRDDVVFLILLYQRYIYRIDYSRVNEYGQVAEDEKDNASGKEGDKEGKVESKKDK